MYELNDQTLSWWMLWLVVLLVYSTFFRSVLHLTQAFLDRHMLTLIFNELLVILPNAIWSAIFSVDSSGQVDPSKHSVSFSDTFVTLLAPIMLFNRFSKLMAQIQIDFNPILKPQIAELPDAIHMPNYVSIIKLRRATTTKRESKII